MRNTFVHALLGKTSRYRLSCSGAAVIKDELSGQEIQSATVTMRIFCCPAEQSYGCMQHMQSHSHEH